MDQVEPLSPILQEPAAAPAVAHTDTASGRSVFRGASASGVLEVRESEELRWMQFDNGILQSGMSLRDPDFPIIPYTRYMLGCLLFRPSLDNVLLLGLGGGGLYRFLRRALPDARLTAVERDPAVIDVARRFFRVSADLDEHVIVVDDAANFITHAAAGSCALVLADLCDGAVVPDLYRRPEFWSDCARVLDDAGIAVFNMMPGSARDFITVLRQVRRHFDRRTLVCAVPDYRNVVIFAFRAESYTLDRKRLDECAAHWRQAMGVNFTDVIDRLFADNSVGDSTASR